MSENTKIEWADHTFNPWIGCTQVSPGCDNCYAAVNTASRALGIQWGPGQARHRTKTWSEPEKWNRAHEAFQAQHGRRQRVFCASLADVFDNEVDPQWRADLFNLIEATPNLDWLLLTKRIGNANAMMYGTLLDRANGWTPPGNLWLGATIVNQTEADRDIPKLLAVPAAKRFLSMEPLLGPVNLTQVMRSSYDGDWTYCDNVLTGFLANKSGGSTDRQYAVDWVIVGGESGPGARPMHPDWARSLRDQCEAAGVPFLFKQWGEWTPGVNVTAKRGTVEAATWFNNQWLLQKEDLSVIDGHADNEPDLYRIGKKAAGRLLDGRTHDGFPEA